MRFVRSSWPLTVLVVTVLASFCTAGAEEPAWPAWRGPRRDGKSPDAGLLKSWPQGGPKQLWEVEGIGNGYSSVTLDGGLVYITGRKPHADEKIEYEEPPRHIWQIQGQGFYVSTIDHTTGEVTQSKDVANAYYEKIHPDGRHENLSYKDEFAKDNMANCNTPIYSDRLVFWACGYGKGGVCLKMTANGQKVAATKAWDTKDADCKHGGMILHEGYLYGNHKNGFVCIEFKTGKTMWDTRDLDKDAETIPMGSVCWADGMFYVFAEKAGEMFLCECTPKGFQIKGHFFAEGFADESGWTKEHERTMGPSWAHPVVAGGKLYLRHFNKVYCYDIKSSR